MRIHYPKLHNMTHTLSLSVFTAFKGTNFHDFSVAGVVLCCCPKKSPRTSFIG